MSLTSIVKSDKELREKFKSLFIRPKLEKGQELLFEPQTKNSSIVGIAFDYLFRFHLERLHVNCESAEWIASKAIETGRIHPDKFDEATRIVFQAKEMHSEFLNTGVMTNDFVRQVLSMSYIDPVFRSGFGYEYIGRDIDDNDVEDVVSMLNHVNFESFQNQKFCSINPTFGEPSRWVGGADADIILGSTLIDLKTTKKCSFTLDHFCQLLGYYMLHRADCFVSDKNIQLDSLAIYYARFGYFFKFKVTDLIEDDELQSFSAWFLSRFQK